MTLIRRKFANDGDMQLNVFVTETEATIQAVATRLRLFLGEWFLNKEIGIDYFGKILKKNINLREVELELKTTINQTDGVKELLKFEMTYNAETRELGVQFTALDDWGNEISNEDLVGINAV
jgi:hypothetical protein